MTASAWWRPRTVEFGAADATPGRAILRQPAFGDVEACENLYTRISACGGSLTGAFIARSNRGRAMRTTSPVRNG